MKTKALENIVRKGENAGKQAFWKHWEKEKLLVTVFSTHLDSFLPFSSNMELSSANSFSLD